MPRLTGSNDSIKEQRIRDSLHNLIIFKESKGTDLDAALWHVIQTPEFQRLRRVRQLGFSEQVYPGATHTRFAHSLGAFHIARRLIKVIEKSGVATSSHRADVALAAALLHDIGHGPFSHAFEDVTAKLGQKYDHEKMSAQLIRKNPIARILNNGMGDGFAGEVADMIEKAGKKDIYNAVISSQFDADRLDYMMRDRLMTGTQLGSVDMEWLLNNLDVKSISASSGEEEEYNVKIFILNHKAIHAAESYVLNLFHLYPTVYFHKATRGMEKIFSNLMLRMVELIKGGSLKKTGLPQKHPLVKFATTANFDEGTDLLDDTMIWGALPLMTDKSVDPIVNDLAGRLLNRRLYKCLDVKETLTQRFFEAKQIKDNERLSPEITGRLKRLLDDVEYSIDDFIRSKEDRKQMPTIFVDKGRREPYKSIGEEGFLNQIMVRTSNDAAIDIKHVSYAIAGLKDFSFFRCYWDGNGAKTEILKRKIDGIIKNAITRYK